MACKVSKSLKDRGREGDKAPTEGGEPKRHCHRTSYTNIRTLRLNIGTMACFSPGVNSRSPFESFIPKRATFWNTVPTFSFAGGLQGLLTSSATLQ
jgi:hypothetical protein